MEHFERAVELDPEVGIEPAREARHLVAEAKAEEARALARSGDIDRAAAVFEEAKDLDPEIVSDPKSEAEETARQAVPSLLRRARELAEQGHAELAIELFRKVAQLRPDLSIDPKAEARNSEINGLLEKGKEFAWHGKVDDALAAYERIGELNPQFEIPAEEWDRLCWNGSLFGHAADVLEACEKAVQLDPGTGLYGGKFLARESRGIARALSGDIGGAIDDFQAFIEWTDDDAKREQYQGWVDAHNSGSNAFAREEIDKLRNR
jgi:tetratricopeptide (TPR) repeat protein